MITHAIDHVESAHYGREDAHMFWHHVNRCARNHGHGARMVIKMGDSAFGAQCLVEFKQPTRVTPTMKADARYLFWQHNF